LASSAGLAGAAAAALAVALAACTATNGGDGDGASGPSSSPTNLPNVTAPAPGITAPADVAADAHLLDGPPTADEKRRDQYGVRYYDVMSDPADFPPPTGFWADDSAGTAVWLEQRRLEAQCMAEQGFDYTYQLPWEPRWHEKASIYAPGSPAWIALYGDADNAGADYSWERGGCSGYAAHATGMDGAH